MFIVCRLPFEFIGVPKLGSTGTWDGSEEHYPGPVAFDNS